MVLCVTRMSSAARSRQRPENAERPSEIGLTKQVQVIQHMVELVQLNSRFTSRGDWPCLFVGPVKVARKPAEQL